MLTPRVDVLTQLPRVFWFERVSVQLPKGSNVRLERWHDERGFPHHWELRINGRVYIECNVPITIAGLDPFEQWPERACNCGPNLVGSMDLSHMVDAWPR